MTPEPASHGESRRKLLILTFHLDRCSETFIHRHFNDLPFDIESLHGNHLNQTADGVKVGAPHKLLALVKKLKGLAGLPQFLSMHDRRLAEWMKSRRIDAVLAEYGTTGIALARACRRAEIPLLVNFLGYDAYRNDAVVRYRREYCELFESADCLLGVSPQICQQLIHLGAPAAKVHHVPPSFDASGLFRAEPAQSECVFLAIGRFVPKKSPASLLSAFAKVHRAFPEARLEWIGDGPLLRETQNQAEQAGLSDAVTFHGACDHGFCKSKLAKARCFVQHSVIAPDGDSEGTPVAILEAQAAGLPVISTRHAGIPDVVVENETGYLVDEHDTDGMAEAMLRLARDAEKAGVMGQAARERVRVRFSHDKTIGKLSELINRAIDQRSEGALS